MFKEYFNGGRTLKWGEDLTSEQSDAMFKGEIFTLLHRDGSPCSEILKDSYGRIREKLL